MSGLAGGMLLVPLMSGVGVPLALVLTGGALVAAADAAVRASSAYEKHRRAERRRIAQRDSEEMIGQYRDAVLHDMREETRRNAEVSAEIGKTLERGRQEAGRILESGGPEKYGEYLGRLRNSRNEINREITSTQDGFAKEYEARIAKSMEAVKNSTARRRELYMGELQSMRGAGEKKLARAKELADIYLMEAGSLIESLRGDFEGEHFGASRLASLSAQVREAVAQYGIGQYEACIAVAHDASVAAIEEIYRADLRRQEWENYHKLALSLAAETEVYLRSQETITPEAHAEIERRAGRELEKDIIGARIGDYTDRTPDGRTEFDCLLEKVSKLKQELESVSPSSMSAARLRETASELNGKIYPAAMTFIYKGILNMNNAFTRQNLSEEIVDFFEEHNFTFSGYSYDGGRHDGALRIGLENGVTGEEIVVTLAPEIMSSGDVQTRVSIDQLKGDGGNEERKEYYRQAVREAAMKGIPGASVSLECDQSTRNRLSENTALREKLRR